MSDFLSADYQAPKTKGGYMKWIKGDNKFRILDKPLMTWEDWVDKKPVRSPYIQGEPAPITTGSDNGAKFCWSLIVWDYADGAVKILNITQQSIYNNLASYAQNEKWGSPLKYDFVVTRKGDGLETNYELMGEPHSELTKEQSEAFKACGIDLNKLMTNDNPFTSEEPEAVVKDDLPWATN